MNSLIAIRQADGSFSRRDRGVRPFYSISKTFIAACVVDLGIDLERSASDWLDADWLPGGDRIRVRHLLTHSAGLRDYGMLPGYAAAVRSGAPVWPDATFAAHTLHKPRLFEPGAGFAYSNPGYWVLKRVLEIETGDPFAHVVRRRILEPLSLTDTAVVSGRFADDLPRYAAGWVWHGLVVGSAADCATFMASDLVQPLRNLRVAVPGRHAHWQQPHYGLGLMIEPGVRFGHNGGGPGYTAASYGFEKSGTTICVLMQGGAEEGAMIELLRLASDAERQAEGLPGND